MLAAAGAEFVAGVRVDAGLAGFAGGALSCEAPGTSDSQPRCAMLGSASLATPMSATSPRTATQPMKTVRRDPNALGTRHLPIRTVVPARAVDFIVHLRSKVVTTLT